MAVSGVNTTLDTVRQVITDALAEIGVGGVGQSPDPNDLEIGRRRLNWMLKNWQNDGLNLWRDDEITIPWPAYTVEGDLDQQYLDLTEVRVDAGNGFERPLSRMEASDYANYPLKLQTGATPFQYVVERNTTVLTLKLWPVPDVDVTLYASGNRVIYDVVTLDENVDVPQQYTNTVMLCLAKALIAPFGKASDPNAALTAAEADKAYKRMLADDRPASYFMGADRNDYARAW